MNRSVPSLLRLPSWPVRRKNLLFQQDVYHRVKVMPSWDSSVDIVTRLRAGQPWNRGSIPPK